MESEGISITHSDTALHKVLKNNWVVDPENGPYKTIQDAIDAAEPGGVIKIAPGLYSDNLVINKPNLKLEPKEKLGDIIIVVSTKPGITINLKPHEKCTIIGLKLSHSGNNEEVEKFEKMGEAKNVDLMNLFKSNEEISPDTKDPYQELVNKFEIDANMNVIILLNGGKLYLEDCMLSLNFIVKTHVNILPALVINEGAEAILNKCEIKGNKNHLTIGILSRNADLVVKETKVHNHKAGGILVQAKEENTVRIANSKIVFNDIVGVHFVGEDSSPSLGNNRIENNNGPGIKIGIANKAKVIKNIVKLNMDGIHITSADPHIFKNKIEKNYQNAIFTCTHDDIRCDGLMEKNEISANKRNGIHVTGLNNFSRVIGNSVIQYNKLAGIRVDGNAHCSILRNSISKNLAQGILVVETASAHIEKNSVFENIKANIALGGQNSTNTAIVDNKIEFGRCEGIFLISGGQCYIHRNQISENNEGLVSITSIPDIRGNIITKNKSNGIMMLKDTRAHVIGNIIKGNDGIGLYIRDKSHGEIKNNTLSENEIDLVVERKHDTLTFIQKDNTIEGDARTPQNFLCNIF